jgi:hypothetical protein
VPAFTTGRDDIRDDVSVCRPAQRIASAHGVQITGRNVRSAGQIDFLVGTAARKRLQQRLQLTDGATLTIDSVLHHSNEPGVERCTRRDAGQWIGGHEAYADADDE